MAGLILVSVLLSVPLSAVTNWSERLTLSLAWGVSLVLVLGRPLKPWLLDLGAAGVSPSKVMFSVWIAISALSYLVTRRLASQQGRED